MLAPAHLEQSHGQVPPSRLQVHDPLYGKMSLPNFLHELLSCWEIQRLRYVRLINVNSVPLPTLGDTYRFAHILGTIRLGTAVLAANGISADSDCGRLLLSALAIHDIGTPAFGHSLEYVIRERDGRDHVDVAVAAISGTRGSRARRKANANGISVEHAWKEIRQYDLTVPEQSQFIDHSGLRKELQRILGSSFASRLEEALHGRGPVGHLVSSSSIDLDNIDNVFRMAAALGIRHTWALDDPLRIASALRLPRRHEENVVACAASSAIDSVRNWHATRNAVYKVLNLDPMNLAGLAMLREFFEEYALTRPIDSSSWWTADADVLESMTLKHTSTLASRIRRGELYSTVTVFHIDTSEPALRQLEGLVGVLRPFSERLGELLDHRVRVHAILDRGTFDRQVFLHALDSGEDVQIGTTSRSIVISIHSKSARVNGLDASHVRRLAGVLL